MARFDPFSSDKDHPLLNSSPDFTPRTALYRVQPIGDRTPSTSTNLSFRERFKGIQDTDGQKNKLISDLVFQLETSQRELEQLQHEYAREAAHNRDSQTRHSLLQEQLEQAKSIMDRDPYISVLIDGDGTLFLNDLIKSGEKGGREAADRLTSVLNTFVSERWKHLLLPKVKLRIYANFRGLIETLVKTKTIEKPSLFEDFVRGFNSSKLLFDFVDAGTKKDRAGDKLSESLRLELPNCHCHGIVLGVSHNDDYAQFLQELTADLPLEERVTLIESVPFGQKLQQLIDKHHFDTIKYETIFQSTKRMESVVVMPSVLPKNLAMAAPVIARVESSSTNGLKTPALSAASTPQTTWASLAAQPVVAAAASSTTRASTPGSNTGTPQLTHRTPAVIIERNRSGQRIDKHDTTIPYHELARIKKLKLCNIYYLQGKNECDMSNCGHSHKYPITQDEKKTLREVARMTPCYYKADCKEPGCIYGHRCPQNKPDEDGCYYGTDCRFWGWGHGIDTTVVKTTKV